MASSNEIQNRISSIKDTMKITKAMYMMSSMKLRKAKKKLEDTEPYFYGLQEQITDMMYHFPDMKDLFFDNRAKDEAAPFKKKCFIVLTGDKGMAGAYNHNVMKEAEKLVATAESYRLFVVGETGRHYFKSEKYNVENAFYFSTNNPSMHRARVMTEYIVDLYKKEEFDEVYVIYTRMINSMKEEVEVNQLLPLKTHEFLKEELRAKAETEGYQLKDTDKADEWFLIYPSAREILERLVYNYVTGFLYGALVESSASEENARMLAMQAATDNAEAILHDLQIEYNRVRQAAITQEITEVIGGAKALRNKKKKAKK